MNLNNKPIGDGYPVYYVAEAGATHTGLDSTRNLIDIAVIAGFDAVKFQIVESAKCPHPDELFNGHKCIDIWRQRELSPDEWRILHEYCKEGDITAFVTITDINQIDWFPSETYKIRSRDITNLDLIRNVSMACCIVQLDIGNATIKQIETAIEVAKPIGYNNVILHHCPSGYPAKIENEKLSLIREYKKKFNCPIAYSVHSMSYITQVMAIAMGANMIEIPIKEDISETIAPEGAYALQPVHAKERIEMLRYWERAL